jgi:peptide deformylase
VNTPVEEFNDDLKQLIRELFLVMHATDGVGLAAPQVGVNKRLLVFQEESDSGELGDSHVLVNPQIVKSSEDLVTVSEGCLSFPAISGRVIRSSWVEVEYQTEEGVKTSKRFDGRPAVILQHEYDHLDRV